MIVVHHPNNLRPQRILWLLEELRLLPYEIKFCKRHLHANAALEELKGPPARHAYRWTGRGRGRLGCDIKELPRVEKSWNVSSI
jgi:hypothetical protein